MTCLFGMAGAAIVGLLLLLGVTLLFVATRPPTQPFYPPAYPADDSEQEPQHYKPPPLTVDDAPAWDWTPTDEVPWQVKHTAKQLAEYIREKRWEDDGM